MKQTYKIEKKGYINGMFYEAGGAIEMTEKEAKYFVMSGHLSVKEVPKTKGKKKNGGDKPTDIPAA